MYRCGNTTYLHSSMYRCGNTAHRYSSMYRCGNKTHLYSSMYRCGKMVAPFHLTLAESKGFSFRTEFMQANTINIRQITAVTNSRKKM